MSEVAEIQVFWPGNRIPVTALLDDPTPCRNPAWYEHPEQGHVAVIPNSFTQQFADVIDRTGAAGKFSIVPCPGAQGITLQRRGQWPREGAGRVGEAAVVTTVPL